jgi:hypothetical protein
MKKKVVCDIGSIGQYVGDIYVADNKYSLPLASPTQTTWLRPGHDIPCALAAPCIPGRLASQAD